MSFENPREFQMYAVGGKCPLLKGVGEGVFVSIDSSGITLFYNFIRPTLEEIEQVKSNHSFEIRILPIKSAIYFLTKCGSLGWTDASYSPFLNSIPFEEQAVAHRPEGSEGYALNLIMADAATTTIKHIRLIGLGHVLSCALYDEIQTLYKKGSFVILPQYHKEIERIEAAYTPKQLANMASIRWCLNSEQKK